MLGDRDKDTEINGRDVVSSAELLAGAAGLFGGKYASHTLQELLTDPAWLNRFGTIGRYNPYREGLSPIQRGLQKAARVTGRAARSAAVSHVFNPETGKIEPTAEPDQQ